MMTDVRRFEFPPRTQLQLKERVKAIAWATNKVGGWRGSNVTAAIQKYLQEAGYRTSQAHIKLGMDYLVKHNLAVAVVLGRRTTEFIMASDAEVDEPDFIKAQRIRAATHGPEVEPTVVLPAAASNGHAELATGQALVVAPSALPGRGRPMPRLPRQRSQDPERLDEMLAALRAWYQTDPEACELWIGGVLHDLGVE